MTGAASSAEPAAPQPKPLARLGAAVIRHADHVSSVLYILGAFALLLLPLAGVAIYHDENAMLVGHSRSVISKGPAVRASQRLAEELIQYLEPAGGQAPQSRDAGVAKVLPVVPQHTAMLTAERCMQRLGMETYWQTLGDDPSSRPGGGGGSRAVNRSVTTTAAAGSARQQSPIASVAEAAWHAGRCANLHGILRAPRGDGKEGLVLSTPLALSAPEEDLLGWRQTSRGAALALGTAAALAEHLAGVRWLAKDLVWLVPDARCGLLTSTEAWLAQYQDGVTCPSGGGSRTEPATAARAAEEAVWETSEAAPAFGRAGQLQQAVVLQFGGAGGDRSGWQPSEDAETEAAAARRAANAVTLTALLPGAAGQLPKLDLFFLFRRSLQYHGGGLQIDTKPEWLRLPTTLPAMLLPRAARCHVADLWTGAVFAAQQAVGLPTGSHAAFKPYAVDAVTLQLPAPAPGAAEAHPSYFLQRLAPPLELTWRSLNALLERFHHSYFLYVLLSPDRFVKVEVYLVPGLCFLLALAAQAAAAAANQAKEEQATGQAASSGGSGSLSWPAALRLAALLHGVPAAMAVAVRCAFQHQPCGGGSAAGSIVPLWASALPAAVSPGSAAAAVAVCVLAGLAWRHSRPAAAGRLSSGISGGGGAGGSSGLFHEAEAFQAALAGRGWRRLKAVLLLSALVQLSAMACIDWAAAAAALVVISPWLCIARPAPQGPQSSVAERGSFLLLVVLSPWTLAAILSGLAAAGGGSFLPGLLHDVAGPVPAWASGGIVPAGGVLGAVARGVLNVLRLLAASPVLSALLAGVWAPAWVGCAVIAVSPADRT